MFKLVIMTVIRKNEENFLMALADRRGGGGGGDSSPSEGRGRARGYELSPSYFDGHL